MSTLNEHFDLSLTQRTRLAVLWNTGIVTLISIGQFGVMLVMVRLLSPEVYGEYGLLMAIMGFLYVFSAQNIVDYTLQVRRESDVNYQGIFTTSVGLNVLLFFVVNAIAVGVRILPDYASVAVPLHCLSFGFLLQPGRTVHIAMLKRALDWKRIRTLHGIGFVMSTCACIPLAYAGAGIYALVVPTLIVPLPFLYDLFVRRSWRPSWSWHFESLKPALAFGLNRQFSGFVVAGRRLLESTVIVQVLGFASFGVYGRAVGLAELVCARMLGQAIDALYPSLTKVEPRTARFRRVSGVVLRASSWFAVPAAALVAQLSIVVVKLIYGEKWLEVIPLVSWSMAAAAAGAIYFTLYKLLLAHEQQRQCFWLDVVLLAGTVFSLYVLLPGGLVSYLQGLIVTQAVLISLAVVWLYADKGLTTGDVMRALIPPALATAGASAALTVRIDAMAGEMLQAVLLAGQVALYALLYVGILRLAFPGSLNELVSYMPKREFMSKLLFLR